MEKVQDASRIYTVIEDYACEDFYLHKCVCKMRFQKPGEREEEMLKDPIKEFFLKPHFLDVFVEVLSVWLVDRDSASPLHACLGHFCHINKRSKSILTHWVLLGQQGSTGPWTSPSEMLVMPESNFTLIIML